MTLVKWTPQRNMFNMFDEVDQMIRQAFGYSPANDKEGLPYNPLMNISEMDQEYRVMMDIPGVEKKDVDVNLSNGMLTVSGERKKSDKHEGSSPIWHEASCGTFSRAFKLSSNIVEDKIRAKFSNGVLNITIPKAEDVKPAVKRIAVR